MMNSNQQKTLEMIIQLKKHYTKQEDCEEPQVLNKKRKIFVLKSIHLPLLLYIYSIWSYFQAVKPL